MTQFTWFVVGWLSAFIFLLACLGAEVVWPDKEWTAFAVKHQCVAVQTTFKPERRAVKCDDGFTYYP